MEVFSHRKLRPLRSTALSRRSKQLVGTKCSVVLLIPSALIYRQIWAVKTGQIDASIHLSNMGQNIHTRQLEYSQPIFNTCEFFEMRCFEPNVNNNNNKKITKLLGPAPQKACLAFTAQTLCKQHQKQCFLLTQQT